MKLAQAIALIVEQAPSYDATVLEARRNEAHFRLILSLLDGRQVERQLLVVADGDRLSAREPVPTHLPAFCPDRHLNGDGSFCLGWSGHEDKRVLDEAGAASWWAKQLQFFRLQERASRLRHWPDRRVWAHGGAAQYQLVAEKCARALGKRIETALEWGRLTLGPPIRRSASNGPAIELLLEGAPILRVWCDHRRLVNMRQPCVCDKSRNGRRVAIRGCSNHATLVIDLVGAMLAWRAAEREFWAGFKDRACCGTLDHCPLKDAAPTPATDHDQERKAA